MLAFVDQAGQLLFFWIRPVRRSPVGIKPMDLGIRIELLSTQHRMCTTKGDHAPSESIHLLVPFQKAPVTPTGLVVLAVRIIVAALCAAKFVPSQEHRHAA